MFFRALQISRWRCVARGRLVLNHVSRTAVKSFTVIVLTTRGSYLRIFPLFIICCYLQNWRAVRLWNPKELVRRPSRQSFQCYGSRQKKAGAARKPTEKRRANCKSPTNTRNAWSTKDAQAKSQTFSNSSLNPCNPSICQVAALSGNTHAFSRFDCNFCQ